MNMTYTIKGQDAIRLAERDNLTLRKYADPIDGARVVTVDEAIEIAREDSSLIYVTVTPVGWTDDATGYNVCDYFQPADCGGDYNGPDEDGVEPTWVDAPDISQDEFLRGVAEALNCDSIEAEAQWGGYSRQLSDDGIREIEAGGYSRGVEIGKEIAAL